MKPSTLLILPLLLATLLPTLLPTLSSAAEQTVELTVPGMTCPVCPLTVKKSLQGVAGVETVSVDYDAKTARVVFDDAQTSVDALREATTNAGYPSQLKSGS